MEQTDIKCMICLTDKKKESLIYLCDTQECKGCTCNPGIHKQCLKQWYKYSGKKCPICLQEYYVIPVIPDPNTPPDHPCTKLILYGVIGTSLLTTALILILQSYIPNP